MQYQMNNPFSQQQISNPISREIIESEQYISPTNQHVEIQLLRETGEDSNGKSFSRQFKRTVPPLADGIVPKSVEEIRECFRCCSLIHVSSSRICSICGLIFCPACSLTVKSEDSQVILCKGCEEKSNKSIIKSFFDMIWKQ